MAVTYGPSPHIIQAYQSRGPQGLPRTHEAGGEVELRADLAVHLHELLHDDHQRLLARERILEPVAQDDRQRQALALLVGARRGLGRPAIEVDTKMNVEKVGYVIASIARQRGTVQD